jgi:hypothetical protein
MSAFLPAALGQVTMNLTWTLRHETTLHVSHRASLLGVGALALLGRAVWRSCRSALCSLRLELALPQKPERIETPAPAPPELLLALASATAAIAALLHERTHAAGEPGLSASNAASSPRRRQGPQGLPPATAAPARRPGPQGPCSSGASAPGEGAPGAATGPPGCREGRFVSLASPRALSCSGRSCGSAAPNCAPPRSRSGCGARKGIPERSSRSGCGCSKGIPRHEPRGRAKGAGSHPGAPGHESPRARGRCGPSAISEPGTPGRQCANRARSSTPSISPEALR